MKIYGSAVSHSQCAPATFRLAQLDGPYADSTTIWLDRPDIYKGNEKVHERIASERMLVVDHLLYLFLHGSKWGCCPA